MEKEAERKSKEKKGWKNFKNFFFSLSLSSYSVLFPSYIEKKSRIPRL